jgi:hypothetical protein
VRDSEHDYLRTRLLSAVVDAPVGDKAESLESLVESERSPHFERLMRNRLLVGRYRYGLMRRTEDLNYNRVKSALRRLQAYADTGNQEHLSGTDMNVGELIESLRVYDSDMKVCCLAEVDGWSSCGGGAHPPTIQEVRSVFVHVVGDGDAVLISADLP